MSQSYDLCVIGGGYWGTAIAFEADKAGMKTLLLDDNSPTGASRNAAGLVHPDYYKGASIRKRWPENWTQEDLEASFSWLQEHCGLHEIDEQFSSYLSPKTKLRRGLWIIDSNNRLLDLFLHTRAKVQKLYWTDESWVVWCDTSHYVVSKVVLAAGIEISILLAESQLPPLKVESLSGTAVLADLGKPLQEVHTHMLRPYKTYSMRPWLDGLVRIGDTVVKQSGSDATLELMKAADRFLGKETEPKGWIGGYRPVTDQFIVRKWAKNLVVATGGHRVGLGLSGLVAKKVLQQLGA